MMKICMDFGLYDAFLSSDVPEMVDQQNSYNSLVISTYLLYLEWNVGMLVVHICILRPPTPVYSRALACWYFPSGCCGRDGRQVPGASRVVACLEASSSEVCDFALRLGDGEAYSVAHLEEAGGWLRARWDDHGALQSSATRACGLALGRSDDAPP
jgi:hypothetical protein